LKAGEKLKDATQEEYVRQHLALGEIDEVVSDPELAVAARNRPERAFEFDKLHPAEVATVLGWLENVR